MAAETIGNIAGFETLGLLDGPGVRFVVFMQGCPLRCAYCHNPEMWSEKAVQIQMTPTELVKKIKKYAVYFKEKGGVTISGGEPLLQSEFCKQVFELCKKESIHTCLDTSGFGDNYEGLLPLCDLVILDVKELNETKYRDLVGKPISKFYKFVEMCKKENVKLWLRQVIVPNFNDTKDSVLKLKGFAASLSNVEKIELLPYHSMAKDKYKNLSIEYRFENVPEMDKKRCKELEKYLK